MPNFPREMDRQLMNAILSKLVLEYGGLSCAPNLANAFETVSNCEMQAIFECLVEKGVLRRVNDDDAELAELTRFPEQTVYALR